MAMGDPVTIAALGDSLTQGDGLPPEDGFVPQLQRWLDDAATALAIGESLGERIVLLSTSTGGTLSIAIGLSILCA